MKEFKTAGLQVATLPKGDNGRHLIRLNYKHRGNIKRYGIGRITINNHSEIVLFLGHDDEKNIYIPFDIRNDFDIELGNIIDIQINNVCKFNRLQWYLKTKDPAIYIPAWIATVGLLLTLPSFFKDVILPIVKTIYSFFKN